MFEKMKNNVTRIPGNLTKLNQYQKDIDHLSKLFSEQQLLELMTTTESDQILQMKPAVDILHVLSALLIKSKVGYSLPNPPGGLS